MKLKKEKELARGKPLLKSARILLYTPSLLCNYAMLQRYSVKQIVLNIDWAKKYFLRWNFHQSNQPFWHESGARTSWQQWLETPEPSVDADNKRGTFHVCYIVVTAVC